MNHFAFRNSIAATLFAMFSTQVAYSQQADVSKVAPKGDNQSLSGKPSTKSPVKPAHGIDDYTTDTDNEDNVLSGTPDGDMDKYLCRSSLIVPIEFNINIPTNPAGRGATLKMNVFDVDTNTSPGNPEVDIVRVNDVQVGVLNGLNNTWGINVFNLPPGLLKQGNNLISVDVDTTEGAWCVEIDYGTISLSSSKRLSIDRGWVAPRNVVQGEYINVFAEISGNVDATDSVVFLINDNVVTNLTDPDGDHVYSGQYQVNDPVGKYKRITMEVRDSTGRSKSSWPSIKVN